MSAAEETLIEEEDGVEEPVENVMPILPLKETVVFPDSMIPLAIGQERSIRLVDEAVANDRPIALVTSREGDDEAQSADDLYSVGTAALIHKMIRVPDGTLRILVQGLRRVRLTRIVQDDPYLVGEFEEQPDVITREKEIAALARNVETLFSRIIALVPYLPDELQLAATNAEDPSALANLIATTMRLKTSEKQELLEEADVEARLRRLTVILNRELELLELGTKIQSQVHSEMEKSQREYFLRSQLKAIQEELGEGDEQQAEIAELRAQIEDANLPEEAEKQARRELDRLAKLPSAAAEYGVIRTYLEWILSLPWKATTEDDLDLEKARKILDEDHYDLEKVKERIIEHLAVSKLKHDLSGPILCFVGPPGVGKTSLGQSIARALGRKFVRISVGGVRDEAEIRGHRRTYIGAMPGRRTRSS
jgi:ATP-dependent Lon protease